MSWNYLAITVSNSSSFHLSLYFLHICGIECVIYVGNKVSEIAELTRNANANAISA